LISFLIIDFIEGKTLVFVLSFDIDLRLVEFQVLLVVELCGFILVERTDPNIDFDIILRFYIFFAHGILNW